MNKTKVLRIILLVLILAWALVVFYLSGQNGGESSGFSTKLIEIFTKNEEIIEKVEPYIRKLAHFSEYGLGGILFLLLFNTYEWTDRRKMITSICLGIWYATTDEIHQLMVPGRHGTPIDVYIDTLGFSTGVCVMMLILKLVMLKKNTKELKNEK
jgi:VanZ family protein